MAHTITKMVRLQCCVWSVISSLGRKNAPEAQNLQYLLGNNPISPVKMKMEAGHSSENCPCWFLQPSQACCHRIQSLWQKAPLLDHSPKGAHWKYCQFLMRKFNEIVWIIYFTSQHYYFWAKVSNFFHSKFMWIEISKHLATNAYLTSNVATSPKAMYIAPVIEHKK